MIALKNYIIKSSTLFLINSIIHSIYPITFGFLFKKLKLKNSFINKFLRIPFPFDESIWAHVKMGYTSTIIYYILSNNLLFKIGNINIFGDYKYNITSLLIGPIIFGWLVPTLFYGYISLTNKEYLSIDILITLFNSFIVEKIMYLITLNKFNFDYLGLGVMIFINMGVILTSIKHSFDVRNLKFKNIFEESEDPDHNH